MDKYNKTWHSFSRKARQDAQQKRQDAQKMQDTITNIIYLLITSAILAACFIAGLITL